MASSFRITSSYWNEQAQKIVLIPLNGNLSPDLTAMTRSFGPLHLKKMTLWPEA